MSEAVTATGIKIQRADISTPTVFSDVGEVDMVSPGNTSRNKIETTTHNDGAESHVLGILRNSDPSFHINYVGSNATHATILSDLANNTKAQWRVLFPSGVKRTGPGYVQAFDRDDAPVDAKQGAKITWTWAGPVTEAAS